MNNTERDDLERLEFWRSHHEKLGHTAQAADYQKQIEFLRGKKKQKKAKKSRTPMTLEEKRAKRKARRDANKTPRIPLTAEQKKAKKLQQRQARKAELQSYLRFPIPKSLAKQKKRKPQPFDSSVILYWGYEQLKANDQGFTDFDSAFQYAVESDNMELPTTISQVKKAKRDFNREFKSYKK